jgi:hypothetical protein
MVNEASINDKLILRLPRIPGEIFRQTTVKAPFFSPTATVIPRAANSKTIQPIFSTPVGFGELKISRKDTIVWLPVIAKLTGNALWIVARAQWQLQKEKSSLHRVDREDYFNHHPKNGQAEPLSMPTPPVFPALTSWLQYWISMTAVHVINDMHGQALFFFQIYVNRGD